jgi:hypothetical protein
MAGDFGNSHVEWISSDIDWISIRMITEIPCVVGLAVMGEFIQLDSLPDSRRDAFNESRTKTSANVASHARITNAKCLFHNKCSRFANCNHPNCKQKHFDNTAQARTINHSTSKNTREKKGICQINSQTD